MTRVERITIIGKLNLKLQCYNRVHVITEMNIYIHLKGTIAIPKQEQQQPQIIETKKQYLKLVLHLLIALAK